ncbi:MAG: Site-specific recombinase [Frankiales bacterium]|nr:Site-specific recombinase [Frankiales bacterium]
MTKAAIYTRLSQDRTGEAVVVARQERACRELAERLGWDVTAVFTDNDTSAYGKKPRREYREMLEDVKGGRIDAVLAYHSDRLYRHPADLEELVRLAEAHSLQIATAQSGDLDLSTSAGRMVARILGSTARGEVERLAERTKAGKNDAASRGAWNGGQRVYGYEVVPVAERAPGEPPLRVVEAEAEVVRDVAERVLAGESLRGIARTLTEAGVTTTTGKTWTGSALRKVLVRPTTAGLRATGGEVVGKGQWEPLLSEDVWRGVVALLSDPSRKTTTRYTRTYLGSGIYLCGVCGGPLTGNTTAGGGPGDRRAAYRCRTADRDGSSHVVRAVATLDEFVVSLVLERLSRVDAVAGIVPPRPDTAPLHVEAGALRERLDDAARGWAAGVLSQSQLTAATAELRARLEDVEARIGQANQGSALVGLAGPKAAETWETLLLDRRRAAVDLLMTVTVLPRNRTGRLPGGDYWDPAAVRVEWKA